ncbi:MAG: hypothetical protein LKJ95_03655 [Bacteroidales bacterium]|jgi:predicted secreted protein|nr:hypothetical protein [Bacteroidales bacterium]
MSNTFDINRFGKYLLYDMKMAWKRYGYGFLFMSFFPIVNYIFGAIFFILFSEDHNLSDYHGIEFTERAIIFGIACVILVLSMPKGVYGHVTDKEKGSSWLMLPASRLEKFTAMMLNCLVIAPLIFLGLYLATDATLTAIDPQMGDPLAIAGHKFSGGVFSPGNSGIQISSFAFAALVFISLIENLSVFLTGAVYFKKNKVLFTILILTGLQTIFSWIIMILGMSADDLPMWLESFNPTAQDFVNFLNWGTNISLVITLCITGSLIWMRLKKLQH